MIQFLSILQPLDVTPLQILIHPITLPLALFHPLHRSLFIFKVIAWKKKFQMDVMLQLNAQKSGLAPAQSPFSVWLMAKWCVNDTSK